MCSWRAREGETFRKCQMPRWTQPQTTAAFTSLHSSCCSCSCLFIYLLIYLIYLCMWGAELNLPHFEFVASQVRVLSLSLRSCSTVGPWPPVARSPGRLLSPRIDGAYGNNHFARSVRPVRSPIRLFVPLPTLLAARNFVGKLRLMIMFNELYNK